MAETPAFPCAPAVGEIDAGKQAAVESIRMSAMNDEIVEVGLQSDRGPTFFRAPSIRAVRDGDAADAGFGAADAGSAADQKLARARDARLNDAVAGPRVLPKLRAGGRRDADRAR